MKKIFVLFSGWALFMAPLCAQEPAAAPGTRVLPTETATGDPSVLAMRESQRLQKALALDAGQTKKVYKLFYSRFKKENPQKSGFGAPGMGGPRGMGHGPGAPGMGGPGGMSGGPGRPGASGFGASGPGQEGVNRSGEVPPEARPRQAGSEESRREADAWRKKLDKKFRKIFTAEQYAAWERMTPQPHPGTPTLKEPANGNPGLRPERSEDPASGRAGRPLEVR